MCMSSMPASVTLAVSGEHSVPLLASRVWETLIGAALGLAAAMLLLPLRPIGRGAERGLH